MDIQNFNTTVETLRGIGKDEFTDSELKELLTLLPFDEYFDYEKYEYSGNYILTKDYDKFEQHMNRCCCGVVDNNIELSNGQMTYFGFDYGH
jgi:hypothetical protein